MRLGRENTLVLCGLALLFLPWLGIPAHIKIWSAAGFGGLVLLLSLSVRYRVKVLKRKLASREYVEPPYR